ncbi:hypothetical protein J4E89_007070 [Alternaria sp. Ai002NY15]|nr:hypothetical protein J4E89_007070 [Alternaria sp. Ai002NY15]
MASTDTKKRKRKPYKSKALMMEHLGFDREQAFDDWRASDLVKPHWERFSKHFLDSPYFKFDKKVGEFKRVWTQIINGEKGGAMTFSTRTNRQYTTDMDWHAWLLYWLVKDNTYNRDGCFYYTGLDRLETYRCMWDFIAFEKRQHAPSSSIKPNPNEAASSESEGEEEHRLYPDEGVASIFWVEGRPEALDEDAGASIQATIRGFGGITEAEFQYRATVAFNLRSHRQVVVELEARWGLTYIGAQWCAHETGKKIIFELTTTEAINEPFFNGHE